MYIDIGMCVCGWVGVRVHVYLYIFFRRHLTTRRKYVYRYLCVWVCVGVRVYLSIYISTTSLDYAS